MITTEDHLKIYGKWDILMRTTGHGIAAGVGKLGAFVGVFLVPELQKGIGLRGMLVVAGGSAVLGLLLTRVLPEPSRRDLEEVSGEDQVASLVVEDDSDAMGEVLRLPRDMKVAPAKSEAAS